MYIKMSLNARYMKFIKWRHIVTILETIPLASNGNGLKSRSDNRPSTLDT